MAGKKNRFMHKTDEMGLSKLAYKFLGGVVHSADTFAALYIPAINSYKRIDADVTTSGSTWAPQCRHLLGQQPHTHDPDTGSRPL